MIWAAGLQSAPLESASRNASCFSPTIFKKLKNVMTKHNLALSWIKYLFLTVGLSILSISSAASGMALEPELNNMVYNEFNDPLFLIEFEWSTDAQTTVADGALNLSISPTTPNDFSVSECKTLISKSIDSKALDKDLFFEADWEVGDETFTPDYPTNDSVATSTYWIYFGICDQTAITQAVDKCIGMKYERVRVFHENAPENDTDQWYYSPAAASGTQIVQEIGPTPFDPAADDMLAPDGWARVWFSYNFVKDTFNAAHGAGNDEDYEWEKGYDNFATWSQTFPASALDYEAASDTVSFVNIINTGSPFNNTSDYLRLKIMFGQDSVNLDYSGKLKVRRYQSEMPCVSNHAAIVHDVVIYAQMPSAPPAMLDVPSGGVEIGSGHLSLNHVLPLEPGMNAYRAFPLNYYSQSADFSFSTQMYLRTSESAIFTFAGASQSLPIPYGENVFYSKKFFNHYFESEAFASTTVPLFTVETKGGHNNNYRSKNVYNQYVPAVNMENDPSSGLINSPFGSGWDPYGYKRLFTLATDTNYLAHDAAGQNTIYQGHGILLDSDISGYLIEKGTKTYSGWKGEEGSVLWTPSGLYFTHLRADGTFDIMRLSVASQQNGPEIPGSAPEFIAGGFTGPLDLFQAKHQAEQGIGDEFYFMDNTDGSIYRYPDHATADQPLYAGDLTKAVDFAVVVDPAATGTDHIYIADEDSRVLYHVAITDDNVSGGRFPAVYGLDRPVALAVHDEVLYILDEIKGVMPRSRIWSYAAVNGRSDSYQLKMFATINNGIRDRAEMAVSQAGTLYITDATHSYGSLVAVSKDGVAHEFEITSYDYAKDEFLNYRTPNIVGSGDITLDGDRNIYIYSRNYRIAHVLADTLYFSVPVRTSVTLGSLNLMGIQKRLIHRFNGEFEESPFDAFNKDQRLSGERWIYDSDGMLQKHISSFDKETTYHYDSSGQLIDITNPVGQKVEFEYSGGFVSAIKENPGTTKSAPLTIDAAGRLVEIGNWDDTTVLFDYATDTSLIIGRTDESGNKTGFEYDSYKRIKKVVDPDQKYFSLEAGQTTYLISNGLAIGHGYEDLSTSNCTNKLGRQIALRTDVHGQLGRIIYGKDDYESIQYDPVNTPQSFRLRDGTFIAPQFDSKTLKKTWGGGSSETEGRPIDYDFDPATGAPVKANFMDDSSVSYEYNAYGLVDKRTDPTGKVVEYVYDANMNISQVNRGNGLEVESYSYDENTGDLIQKTDGRGNSWTYQYDDSRRLTAETNGGTGRKVCYGYTSNGLHSWTYRPLDIQEGCPDSSGPAPTGAIKLVYDGLGRLIEKYSPEGRKRTYEYDAEGHKKKYTDPNGTVTTYVYDEDGKLKVVEIGGDAPLRTEYSYSKAGKVESMSVTANGSDLREQKYIYDGHNQLAIEHGSFGEEAKYEYGPYGVSRKTLANGAVIEYVYDNRGRKIGTRTISADGELSSDSLLDSSGRLTSSRGPGGATETFEFNDLGQFTTATFADNSAASIVYDENGNMTTYTNRLGIENRYEYDAANLLATATYAFGETESLSQAYRYGHLGQMATFTNGLNKSTSYEYDLDGYVTAMIDPMGRRWEYDYDNNGNMTEETPPGTGTIHLTYDDRNRIRQIALPSGDSKSFAYGNGFDLTEAEDADSSLQLTYDDDGRLKSVVNSSEHQPSYRITYTYGPGNVVTGVLAQPVEPEKIDLSPADASFSVETEYDGLGRLKSMYAGDDTIGFAYASGTTRLSSVNFPSGTDESYGYDALGRLNEIAFATQSNVALGRDALGNVTNWAFDGRAIAYDYDGIGRLKNAHSSYGGAFAALPDENYEYDKNHNRTQSSSGRNAAGNGTPDAIEYSYDDASRISEDSMYEFDFDQRGNLIEKESKETGRVWKYIYDAQDQLLNASLYASASDTMPIHWAAYAYDAFGRRIGKNVNGVRRAFIYDGESLLLEFEGGKETDAWVLVARYAHNPAHIDRPLLMQRPRLNENGETVFDSYEYHSGHRGSVLFISDDQGRKVRQYFYDSFGRIGHETGVLANPFTFTGREYDSETGLYYYRARYYDPETGRFLQKDPKGEDNYYTYVKNNPMTLIDPSGAQWNTPDACAEAHWGCIIGLNCPWDVPFCVDNNCKFVSHEDLPPTDFAVGCAHCFLPEIFDYCVCEDLYCYCAYAPDGQQICCETEPCERCFDNCTDYLKKYNIETKEKRWKCMQWCTGGANGGPTGPPNGTPPDGSPPDEGPCGEILYGIDPCSDKEKEKLKIEQIKELLKEAREIISSCHGNLECMKERLTNITIKLIELTGADSWVWSLSGTYYSPLLVGLSAGIELVYIPGFGWRVFEYGGPAGGVPGWNIDIQGGAINNLKKPEDYAGLFTSFQVDTNIIPDVGVGYTAFESPDHTVNGGKGGITIGNPGIGIQTSFYINVTTPYKLGWQLCLIFPSQCKNMFLSGRP